MSEVNLENRVPSAQEVKLHCEIDALKQQLEAERANRVATEEQLQSTNRVLASVSIRNDALDLELLRLKGELAAKDEALKLAMGALVLIRHSHNAHLIDPAIEALQAPDAASPQPSDNIVMTTDEYNAYAAKNLQAALDKCKAELDEAKKRIAELERRLGGPGIAECILQNREDERRKVAEEIAEYSHRLNFTTMCDWIRVAYLQDNPESEVKA